MSRIILHVDMDAFFAAIEQLDHPEYRDKPVIVGADPKEGSGRGVVSTCSYQARVYGVRSAMPISQAYKRCPHAIFVTPRGHRYAQVSRSLMDILGTFSPDMEKISVDEAFLDVSSTCKLFGSALQLGITIKKEIRDKTGLTASIGIAPNKFIAKIASDLKKPDGLVIVDSDEVQTFLAPLEINRLWGVGPKTVPVLNRMGIRTIGELADYPTADLVKNLGKAGFHFKKLANGIDERVVEKDYGAKSMSKERTFEFDCDDDKKLHDTLLYLCDDLSHELRLKQYQGRTITLKIRLADFTTFTRSKTLLFNTNRSNDLIYHISDLFNSFNRKGLAVRLLGVAVSNFDQNTQLDLFHSDQNNDNKIDEILDTVKEKFGHKAITRASLLRKEKHSQNKRNHY